MVDQPAEGTPLPPTLADRVDHLFATVRKADGSRYTLREVARGITAAGTRISFSTIGQLRSGEHDNPTLATLRGLAMFFGVPVQYLTGDEPVAGQVHRQLQAMSALHADPGVRGVLVRTRGLSARSLRLVADMLTQMRRAEGLPDIDPELDQRR